MRPSAPLRLCLAILAAAALGAVAPGKEDPPPEAGDELPADLVEFFKEFDPARLDEIKVPGPKGPKSLEDRIAAARKEMVRFLQLKQSQPDEYTLRLQENHLRYETALALDAIKNAATEQGREAAEKTARAALERAYDFEVARQERDVRKREDELRYAHRRLEVWKQHKDVVIESRLAEMLGNKGFFAW